MTTDIMWEKGEHNKAFHVLLLNKSGRKVDNYILTHTFKHLEKRGEEEEEERRGEEKEERRDHASIKSNSLKITRSKCERFLCSTC